MYGLHGLLLLGKSYLSRLSLKPMLIHVSSNRGAVATLQAATTTFAGEATCRFLLGMAEAGFSPGAPYLLSYFYLTYPTVSLPDPASLPLRETPPEPHHNHNPKINSRAMVLEFCIDIL
jgi:hypothetical protein